MNDIQEINDRRMILRTARMTVTADFDEARGWNVKADGQHVNYYLSKANAKEIMRFEASGAPYFGR